MNAATRSAWSWEHQAITRARFVTGDAQIKERFDEIRRSILLMERDRRKLRADILDMRDKISAGHPNRSELFDLKHDRGGMVDVEFITQYLVLCHSREHPKLLENLGNIALLGIAAQAGLIAVDHAQEVADAYRALRRRQGVRAPVGDLVQFAAIAAGERVARVVGEVGAGVGDAAARRIAGGRQEAERTCDPRGAGRG